VTPAAGPRCGGSCRAHRPPPPRACRRRWRGQSVYFEVASVPFAAGEASFIGELLARLGLGNIVPAAMGPFPQLSPEFVLRAQPSW
jgi:ABC-type Fe3+-hydroxamate transport system substrate-binding protein